MELADGLANTVGHVEPGGIAILPERDRLGGFGERLKGSEGRTLPFGGTDDDGNDSCLSRRIPIHRALQFLTPDEVRVDQIAADEKQDQIGGLELSEDLVFPLVTGHE